MKKLAKSKKIVLISVVSFVCILAIVLGCVFGLKPKKPEALTDAQLLAKDINRSAVSKSKTYACESAVYDSVCTVKDINFSNEKYFVYEKDGNQIVSLYKKNSDESYSYKQITETVENGGFVENDAESYKVEKMSDNFVILSSIYASEADSITTNKVMKVICVSDYENPTVIYEFDSRNKNYVTELGNLTLNDNYFAFFYFKDVDSNLVGGKMDVVFGKLANYALSENEIIEIKDRDIKIFANEFEFQGNESFVYLKIKNEIFLISEVGEVQVYSNFQSLDDVSYRFSEIKFGSVLVEKRTVLRDETKNSSKAVIEDSESAVYEYSILDFGKDIKVHSLSLGDGYAKISTTNLGDLNYYYLCEQKIVNNVLQEEYLSKYLDLDFKTVLRYDSKLNEIVLYAKGDKFLTNSKFIDSKNSSIKELKLTANETSDSERLEYSLAQTDVTTDVFVVSTDSGRGLMRIDGSFVVDPKNGEFSNIWPVYGKNVLAKDFYGKYFVLNTETGSKTEILDLFEDVGIFDLSKFGFDGYLTKKDNKITLQNFNGNILLDDIVESKIYYQSTNNGGIVEFVNENNEKVVIRFKAKSSITFSKSETLNYSTESNTTPTNSTAYGYNNITLYGKYYYSEVGNRYKIGTMSYSGTEPQIIKITMEPGYYLNSITFYFTYIATYDMGFKDCTIGYDGWTSLTGIDDSENVKWTVSIQNNTYVYERRQTFTGLAKSFISGFRDKEVEIDGDRKTVYEIEANTNGGYGFAVMDSISWLAFVGDNVKVDHPTKTGYSFASFTLSGMDTSTHYYRYTQGGYPAQTNDTSKTFTNSSYVYFQTLRQTYGTVTFTYYWSARSYVITYDANGGTGTSQTQSVTYDATFTTLAKTTFTKFGYTLSKWNTSADGSGTNYSTSTSYTWGTASNVTLYAIWSANLYQIIVNVDGGNIPEGASQFTPSAGEVFPYNEDTTIRYYKTNGTLAYGGFIWTLEKMTYILVSTEEEGVYYYSQDGSTKTEVNSKTGSVYYKGTTYYYSSFETEGYNTIRMTIDWKQINASTVSDGVEELVDAYYKLTNYDTWFTIDSTSRTGYIFSDWYVKVRKLSSVTGEFTHYYGESSDSYYTSTTNTFRTSAPNQNTFKNLVCENQFTFSNITAEWTPITYNLTYNYNDGEISGTNPTTATYNSVFYLVKPTKKGYTFNGWTISGADNTLHYYGSTQLLVFGTSSTSFSVEAKYNYFKNLTSVDGATITISAMWTVNTYTVIYNSTSGDFSNSYLNGISTITYSDYTFCTLQRSTICKSDIKKLNASLTIYALVYLTEPDITGVLMISTTEQGTYYSYQEKTALFITNTINVRKSGGVISYNGIMYYYCASDGFVSGDRRSDAPELANTSFSATNLSSAAQLLAATYQKKYYKEYSYDSTYSFVKPTKKGYTLNGWFLNDMESGTTHYFGGDSIETLTNTATTYSLNAKYTTFKNLRSTAGNVYANAKWRPNTYNITYKLNGGEWGDDSIHPASATYDIVFQVSNPATAPLGYTFSSWVISGISGTWYYGKGSSSSSLIETEATSGIIRSTYFKNLNYTDGATVTFSAVYSANQYNVNFVENGTGVTLNNSTVQASYNSSFTANNPMRVGYTFTGWALSGLSDEIEHTYHNYTSSSAYSTVNFDSSNGLYVNSINPNLNILVKSDYGSYCGFLNLHYITGATVTLTANWTPSNYTITYHYALNSNFSSFPEIETANTISNMKNTKTQTITFDQYFTTFSNARYDGQDNAVNLPTGYLVKQWVIVVNKELTGVTSSQSSSYVCSASTEYMFDYNFYLAHAGDGNQITSIHAYVIYQSVSITIKYFDATSEDGFNKMGNYTNTSTIKINYGSLVGIPTSSFDEFVGYMISPNMYYAGQVAKEVSVTSYVFDSVTYTAEPGCSIKWGISNTSAYNSDDPVFYLYAVYSTEFTGKTTIRNNTSENIYVTVTATNRYDFSYGNRVYEKKAITGLDYKYLMVQPGQVLVVYENSTSSSVTKYKTKPSDLESEKFFAAFGSYPQTYVGDSLNTTLKNASLSEDGNTYTTMIDSTETKLTGYTVNGVKYAKLDGCSKPYSSSYKFFSGETVSSNQTYFFYVEPIVSVFVEKKDFGSYVFRTIDCMGSMAFNSSGDDNLWENSNIRTFLNDKFYNESSLNSVVETTKVWNNVVGDYNDGSGNSTIDNIWLMSAEEMVRDKEGDWTSAKQQFESNNGYYRKITLDLETSDLSTATYTSIGASKKSYFYYRTAGKDSSSVAYTYSSWISLNASIVNTYYAFYPSFAVNLDGITLPSASEQPERELSSLDSAYFSTKTLDTSSYKYGIVNNIGTTDIYVRVKQEGMDYTYSGAYDCEVLGSSLSVFYAAWNEQVIILGSGTICYFRISSSANFEDYLAIYTDVDSLTNDGGVIFDESNLPFTQDSAYPTLAYYGAYPQTFVGAFVSSQLYDMYGAGCLSETGKQYVVESLVNNGNDYYPCILNEYYYYDSTTSSYDYNRRVVMYDFSSYGCYPYDSSYTFSTEYDPIDDLINNLNGIGFFFVDPIEFIVTGYQGEDGDGNPCYNLMQTCVVTSSLCDNLPAIGNEWSESRLNQKVNGYSGADDFYNNTGMCDYSWESIEIKNNMRLITGSSSSRSCVNVIDSGDATWDPITLPSVWELFNLFDGTGSLDESGSPFFYGDYTLSCTTLMYTSDFALSLGVKYGSFLTRTVSDYYSDGVYVVELNGLCGELSMNVVDTANYITLSQYGIIVSTARIMYW